MYSNPYFLPRRATLPSKTGDPTRRLALPWRSYLSLPCKRFAAFCKEMHQRLLTLLPRTSLRHINFRGPKWLENESTAIARESFSCFLFWNHLCLSSRNVFFGKECGNSWSASGKRSIGHLFLFYCGFLKVNCLSTSNWIIVNWESLQLWTTTIKMLKADLITGRTAHWRIVCILVLVNLINASSNRMNVLILRLKHVSIKNQFVQTIAKVSCNPSWKQ